jgi:hypothetical protein
MKKNLLVLLLLMQVSVSIFGQLEAKMEKAKVVVGVIYQDGAELHGYIKQTGFPSDFDPATPFLMPSAFQVSIDFIPKETFEKSSKIKKKLFKTYKPKDCDGYKYEDMVYETVKYADMSAVGMAMIPKTMFMRKISDGPITLFHHFAHPPKVGINETQEDIIRYRTPNLVYRKGQDGKLKKVNDLNIEKELEDCPIVVERHAAGEYRVVGNEEKQSALNKLANEGIYREQVRVKAIQDYNENCGE